MLPQARHQNQSGVLKTASPANKVSLKRNGIRLNRIGFLHALGGTGAEIVLPFADLPRGALHLGFEDFVGDPAQEIQGGSHCRAPRRCRPVNDGPNLQLVRAARRDRNHKNSFSI